MFAFGALPPEINSGLMYTGPGAGPMTAASAAWDALADDLYLAASGYGSVITELTSWWLGPSSQSMAAAGATYVSWISATAAQAEQTATAAKAAAAAYEVAFAMTVPPAVVAANRALLLALIATNFFGQNTPAIMATEAEYFEMWAQDAAAMYGYAGASSAASIVTPFTAPQATTNSLEATAFTQAAGTSAGTGVQTAAPLATAAMPSALHALASTATSTTSVTSPLSSLSISTSTSSSSSALTAGTGLASSVGSSASMLTSAVSMLGSPTSLANSLGPATGGLAGGFPMFKSALNIGGGPGAAAWGSPGLTVSAASGRAASLGALSVPEGWTSAAPAFSHVSSALPGGGVPRAMSPIAPSGQTSPFGVPRANSTNRSNSDSPVLAHHYFRPAVLQRPVYTG